jgi:hypothetical protein
LLGPPIARACRRDASHEWIHIEDTAEGFDISVDTVQAGTLNGRLNIKGPTGEAAITIQADLFPAPPETPISTPATDAIPASAPAPSHVPETPPTAPSAPQPKPAAVTEPSVPSPRPMVTGPAAPASVPKLGRGMSIFSVFWALLPILSAIAFLAPFLAPLPFAHAAVRLRDRRLWLISAAYFLVLLTLWILFVTFTQTTWTGGSSVFYTLLLAIGLLATIHAFRLRRRVFAPRSPPTVAEPGSPHALPESDEGIARGHRGDRA